MVGLSLLCTGASFREEVGVVRAVLSVCVRDCVYLEYLALNVRPMRETVGDLNGGFAWCLKLGHVIPFYVEHRFFIQI